MGLNRLPREGLSCADLRPLHDLWKGYMAELVDFDKVKNSKGADEQLQVGRRRRFVWNFIRRCCSLF